MLLFCQFCNKECKNLNSQRNHERRCPKNSERVIYINGMLGKKGSNQYIKAREMGLEIPKISEETRKKLSESSSRQGKIRFANPIYREKISIAMKDAVKKYPESYTARNRGRTKQIEKYGLIFQGCWELQFYEYCLEKNILIERNKKGFHYEWHGKRTYFPDFYLPHYNLFIEVKGYETDRDKAKWKYFPHRLQVIRKQDIEDIRNRIPLCLGKE